jgi:hypothetical protein
LALPVKEAAATFTQVAEQTRRRPFHPSSPGKRSLSISGSAVSTEKRTSSAAVTSEQNKVFPSRLKYLAQIRGVSDIQNRRCPC